MNTRELVELSQFTTIQKLPSCTLSKVYKQVKIPQDRTSRSHFLIPKLKLRDIQREAFPHQLSKYEQDNVGYLSRMAKQATAQQSYEELLQQRDRVVGRPLHYSFKKDQDHTKFSHIGPVLYSALQAQENEKQAEKEQRSQNMLEFAQQMEVQAKVKQE